jgi:acyl carrier protein
MRHKVMKALCDSLALEQAEVMETSNILSDLGADSLDLLDILFRVEEETGVRLEREELFPAFLWENETEYVQDEKLTEAGREKVLEVFPFLHKDQVANVESPRALLTVGLLVKIINHKVATGAREELVGQQL